MKMDKQQLWYLGSPYSHQDDQVRLDRFKEICVVQSKLMNQGWYLFGPIAMSHPIAEFGGTPSGWDYWEQFDYAVLKRCDGLLVCTMEGWEQSRGLTGEIAIARELGIPILYVHPESLVISPVPTP